MCLEKTRVGFELSCSPLTSWMDHYAWHYVVADVPILSLRSRLLSLDPAPAVQQREGGREGGVDYVSAAAPCSAISACSMSQ